MKTQLDFDFLLFISCLFLKNELSHDEINQVNADRKSIGVKLIQ